MKTQITNPNHEIIRASRPFFGFKPFAHFWAALGLLLVTGLAQGATLTVQNNADSGAGSLRVTLAAAASGDRISFASALNGQTIVLTNGELAVHANLVILGPGATNLAINGNHKSRIFYVSPGVTSIIAGLTLTNGNSSGTAFRDCGGFLITNAGGAVLNLHGSLTVSNCTVSGNSAASFGGGICSYGSGSNGVLTVLNSTFRNNSSGYDGGGLYNDSGASLAVRNCAFLGNTALNDGGGIANFAALNMQDTTFGTNWGRNYGGGIYSGIKCIGASSLLTVSNSSFSGNYAFAGGGIFSGSPGTLQNDTFAGNWATDELGYGGGIANLEPGNLIIQNTTISSNTAYFGGAIENEGKVTIQNSLLAGNWATNAGGGIYNFPFGAAAVQLQNSTLSGNASQNDGGGIFNKNGGSIRCENTTLSRNSASHLGGGIYNEGALTLTHTLLAKGSTGANFANNNGSVTNLGFNLADDNSSSAFAPNVGNLLLGPLADHGGPTFTHALLIGSPAIDAGTNSAIAGVAYDQRGPGFDRLVRGKMDIGAYELQTLFTNAPIAGLPKPANGYGRDSVAWGDFNNDGRLDLLVVGSTNGLASGGIAQLLLNTGNGFSNVTSQVAAGLPGVSAGAVAWADYDNDGRLDFVITGRGTNGVSISQLWHNEGNTFSNVTSRVAPGLPGAFNSSVAWADYDNDGRVDFIILGVDGPVVGTQLWHNEGNFFSNVTSQVAAGLRGVSAGAVAWGDFDNDGRLDFIIAGQTIAQIWWNTGAGFSNVTSQVAPGLPGVDAGAAVAWGDYDNDGRLDFLLTGGTNTFGLETYFSQVWHNEGNWFSNVTSQVAPDLPGVVNGSVAWGDYDNDGRLDFLLTGYGYGGILSQLWKNTAAGFVNVTGPVTPGLPGDYGDSVSWADYDNDGRLDFLLLSPTPLAGLTLDSQLWRNTLSASNAPPSAPTGLNAQLAPNSLTLNWLAAADDHTPSSSLSYNLVLATASNSVNLAAPMSNLTNGFRRVVKLGNANQRTSWTFHNLPPATIYYWSVQAVDGAFAGGPFAAVHSVANVVFTSIAKPNANQATLTFIATSGHVYTVERSDNLAVWATAGTATESPAGSGHFAFTDNTASGSKRYYRVRY